MKNENYVTIDLENQIMLTMDEINSFKIEEYTCPSEDVQQFVYNIAMVLYKSFYNETL